MCVNISLRQIFPCLDSITYLGSKKIIWQYFQQHASSLIQKGKREITNFIPNGLMISSEVQEITNFISFLFIEHKWMLHAFSDHRGDARISMKLTFALLVSDNHMTLKESVMHEKLAQKQCCL